MYKNITLYHETLQSQVYICLNPYIINYFQIGIYIFYSNQNYMYNLHLTELYMTRKSTK